VTHYDLAVIGTGSGNSIVDDRFADWRVAIIEDNLFGGTCLNVGCIPTKMFVYPADLARSARHAPALGVDSSYDGADWPVIRDRIFRRIDPIAAGGKSYREGQPHVEVYSSHATFVDDHTLATGSGEQITADQIVIAAGSRVDVAPIPGLEEVEFHTSDTVMRLDALPQRMTIIGGGYVAAEFAHVFSALGTAVTQVQRGPVLLRAQDTDIARTFTEIAARQWDLRLDTRPTAVRQQGGTITVSLSDGTEVEADVLLMATGRISNADRLGLEHTSIASAGGRVVVDDHQRTSVDGVWALGDVSSSFELKHVANLEARRVQHNLLNPDDLVASDHRFVPSAVFTSPQIATVGLTEQAAREQGIAYITATHDYADIAYGWAMESTPGEQFVKLIGTPDARQILGAHIIGPQASLLIQPIIQAMSLGSEPAEVAKGQYWIHPAMTEVVENALLKLIRQ
jgi:mycothione reductase